MHEKVPIVYEEQKQKSFQSDYCSISQGKGVMLNCDPTYEFSDLHLHAIKDTYNKQYKVIRTRMKETISYNFFSPLFRASSIAFCFSSSLSFIHLLLLSSFLCSFLSAIRFFLSSAIFFSKAESFSYFKGLKPQSIYYRHH